MWPIAFATKVTSRRRSSPTLPDMEVLEHTYAYAHSLNKFQLTYLRSEQRNSEVRLRAHTDTSLGDERGSRKSTIC